MKVLRGARRATALLGAGVLLATACGGGGTDSGALVDAEAVSLWVTEDAVSAGGTAYGLSLLMQPLPTVGPGADVGFVSFGLSAAPLTIVNRVIDEPTPGFEVDTYLFFDCELLSSEPVSRTGNDELIISAAGWEAEPERLISVDGGHCVQLLDPVSIGDGIAAGAEVTVDVGLEDLGFVVPEEQRGRIETMLGRPLFVQFGITEAAGATFYSPRVNLGAMAAATPGDSDHVDAVLGGSEGDATVLALSEVLELIGDEAYAELLGAEGLAELVGAGADELFGTTFDDLDDLWDADLGDVGGVTAVSAPAAPTECPMSGSEPRRVFDGAPVNCIDPAVGYTATVSTTVGEFTIELDSAAAPATVNNFVVLTRYGFYDDTPCHRIISDFIAQCGDPTGTGLGGPGYSFADELPGPGAYELGSVAMANSGPDSNGSQWFVITGDQGVRLPPNYSLFGKVTDGLDDAVVWMNGLGTSSGTPLDDVRVKSVTISTT
jgi:cyclophilin family peptidyl-prolyl cis-trans isomerase